CDILLETGKFSEAVPEMLRLAEDLIVEDLNGAEAADVLGRALRLDPDNAAAHRMMHDLGYELVGESDLVSEDDPSTGSAPQVIEPPASESPRDDARRGGIEIESALEEAEFFASRGLYEDARALLEEQLVRRPDHPLLLERLRELDTHDPVEGQPTSDAPPADELVDVDEVFAKFKEGLREIDKDDSQTHYDLGLAYKEMGLLEDAVRELESAARDPKRECVSHTLVAMIRLEQGRVVDACGSLHQALAASERTQEQEVAICYELGVAYEARHMPSEALEYYRRARRIDRTFRDVEACVARLESESHPPGGGRRSRR
ncbi:MAG TPA: hypothetical protein VKU41_28245, partial [Polyangiaceae bacterium]|nr:hypothetical protein [Polyangiaceae bacterium]